MREACSSDSNPLVPLPGPLERSNLILTLTLTVTLTLALTWSSNPGGLTLNFTPHHQAFGNDAYFLDWDRAAVEPQP